MFQVSCTECGVFTCLTREELRSHLEAKHGINMELKELEFDSMEQFLQWKKKMEGDEVFFSKLSGEHMINSEKSHLHYGCNYLQTTVQGSLGKKLKASPKIVQICPASLEVSKTSSGKISVKFYMTHTGHSVSTGSHNLTYDATNGTDGITVEEDSATKYLQQGSPGPVFVTVEQINAMPWQQEVQHDSPGPVIMTVEQIDAIPWQQELQQNLPVSVSVTVDETGVISWQEELQHSTSVPGSVTVGENDVLPCQQELQHSTSDVCGYTNCEALCEICGISFRCRKALYKHLRALHDMDSNSSLASLNFHEKMHMPAPHNVKAACNSGDNCSSGVAAICDHMKMHTPAPQTLSCTECGVFTCCMREELIHHLECEHGINMETKDLEFDSMEQFYQWKKKMEDDEKVFFTKLSSEKMFNSEKSRLYYTCCLHSQTAMGRNLAKRLKMSTIIEKTCPACLTVSKLSSGKISVKFYMTHTGPNVTMESHNRTYADRAMLAGHIVSGPNSSDGTTVEEDIVTEDQQYSSPGFDTKDCIAVDHNYATS